MRTLIVTGSRKWADEGLLRRTLTLLHDDNCFELVVDGGAKGADTMAHHWAEDMGLETRTYMAQWGKYGGRAGPMRNVQMLQDNPGALVVGFPLRESIGTKHCLSEARRRLMQTLSITPEGEWLWL